MKKKPNASTERAYRQADSDFEALMKKATYDGEAVPTPTGIATVIPVEVVDDRPPLVVYTCYKCSRKTEVRSWTWVEQNKCAKCMTKLDVTFPEFEP